MEPGFGGVIPDQYFGLAEQEPHNWVHVDVGGDFGEMRSPATAGRDPIFWLHHANIDRIWEMWRSLDGSVEFADSPIATVAMRSQWNSAEFWFGDEGSPRRTRWPTSKTSRHRRWTMSTSRSSSP